MLTVNPGGAGQRSVERGALVLTEMEKVEIFRRQNRVVHEED